jgi:GT2 family glycosyltransferase
MKYLYLCVNYDSSATLEKTIPVWKKLCNGIEIYIVDNFKSIEERKAVSEICKEFNATIICNENNGYGDALNKGIDVILSNPNYDGKSILFFGNSDIIPIERILPINNNGVPVLNIYQEGRKLNPFLTKLESAFIWILCLSAKLHSKTLLYLWYAFRRLVSVYRGKSVAAVHGSLFCLSLAEAAKLHPIFDSKVFLYCEELFFMRKIMRNNLSYTESPYVFEHIGSVSTGKTIKLDDKAYFDNWCKSMKIYCDD